MILEVVEVEIVRGLEEEFERGVAKALAVFQQAQGFISLTLVRGIEERHRFRLHIYWQTLEDHTVNFRNSDGFQQWRALVGHCFAAPPRVDHSTTVLAS